MQKWWKRTKTYSQLKDKNEEGKKAKGTKMYVIKRKIKFKDYKNFLEALQIEIKQTIFGKIEIHLDSVKEG